MKLTPVYFIILFLLISNSTWAQVSEDSLKKSYSKKLIGSWVGQNEFKESGDSKKTAKTFTNDTLIFSADSTYYLSRGGNIEKHWSGAVSSGTWEVNLKPVTHIYFREKKNNRKLTVSDEVYTIVNVNENEFTFLYDDQSYVYKRLK